jgi:hypothetical protein
MKLTNQQTIEETLVLNGVVYDDIKLELIDHIATEIESRKLVLKVNYLRLFKRGV